MIQHKMNSYLIIYIKSLQIKLIFKLRTSLLGKDTITGLRMKQTIITDYMNHFKDISRVRYLKVEIDQSHIND